MSMAVRFWRHALLAHMPPPTQDCDFGSLRLLNPMVPGKFLILGEPHMIAADADILASGRWRRLSHLGRPSPPHEYTVLVPLLRPSLVWAPLMAPHYSSSISTMCLVMMSFIGTKLNGNIFTSFLLRSRMPE